MKVFIQNVYPGNTRKPVTCLESCGKKVSRVCCDCLLVDIMSAASSKWQWYAD